VSIQCYSRRCRPCKDQQLERTRLLPYTYRLLEVSCPPGLVLELLLVSIFFESLLLPTTQRLRLYRHPVQLVSEPALFYPSFIDTQSNLHWTTRLCVGSRTLLVIYTRTHTQLLFIYTHIYITKIVSYIDIYIYNKNSKSNVVQGPSALTSNFDCTRNVTNLLLFVSLLFLLLGAYPLSAPRS